VHEAGRGGVGFEGGGCLHVYAGLLNGFMAQLSDEEMATVAREFAAQLKHVERSGVVRKFETVQTGLTINDWHLDRLDQRVLPFDWQYSYDLVHFTAPSFTLLAGIQTARFFPTAASIILVCALGRNATFSSRQRPP
jgi:hypothetical protein